ncbi:helix-turn-helix domain-containing protein [Clostridium sp. C105KSO13]|uniref:helix-turn-helix domain-containing protein n=1 Tax=Clostridium sp. C105KSO13 TaxID=1776045 RepID=UPI000740630F|nr:helix-turn-helix domain-containing protein [Clostridium sp. C105KSO13]CUX15115.1 transcriptional repressor DicA [Clostridium sp. C105KSO13]
MDCVKTGKLIAKLRREMKLTQKNIADALGISNKTVSKWECGLGCPDVTYWADLSEILGVDMIQMLEGEITPNKPDSGNIDKVRFYSCPCCGNILTSTGSASIYCCGRKLECLMPAEKCEQYKISVVETDTDYYITFNHPMEKEHFISFAAYVKSDGIFFVRLYPEQAPAVRIPLNTGGRLYLYCIKHGLLSFSSDDCIDNGEQDNCTQNGDE